MGFSTTDSLIVTVITSLTKVVISFLAILFIDRIGRKPLLLIGSVVMSLTLGSMSWVFAGAAVVNGAPQLVGIAAVMALLAANMFVFAFGFGFSWGTVMWVMLGQMFNNRIRAVALGLCAMVNWTANGSSPEPFHPCWRHQGLHWPMGSMPPRLRSPSF